MDNTVTSIAGNECHRRQLDSLLMQDGLEESEVVAHFMKKHRSEQTVVGGTKRQLKVRVKKLDLADTIPTLPQVLDRILPGLAIMKGRRCTVKECTKVIRAESNPAHTRHAHAAIPQWEDCYIQQLNVLAKFIVVPDPDKSSKTKDPYERLLKECLNKLPELDALPLIPSTDRNFRPYLLISQWHAFLGDNLSDKRRRAKVAEVVKLPKDTEEHGYLPQLCREYLEEGKAKGLHLPPHILDKFAGIPLWVSG